MIVTISYIGLYSVNNRSLDRTMMSIFGCFEFMHRTIDVPLAAVLM